MNWTAKHITLPLLIGVSLTGVCVGLYYFFYKKEEENDRKVITLKDRKSHVIELKVARQHVPVIIGRGGTTIKNIEEKTSTRLRFNNDDIAIPHRICTIRGPFECVKLAEAMITSIIENQPIIETYEMSIPQRVQSALLADRGEMINTIQASTQTKIILEKGYPNNPGDKKRLIIKGTADQIGKVLNHIEDMIRELNYTSDKLEVCQTMRSSRGKLSPRNTPIVNKIEQQIPSEESSSLIHEGIMEVYVSAVDNPNQFWVQVNGPGILALDKLVANMTSYYDNKENHELHTLENITLGQVVAAKFSFDNRWYRAEITSLIDDKKYEVFFVDYGDHEIVDSTDILELRTDFLTVRMQAIECSIANIRPKSFEWSEEACDRFSELCWCAQWKVMNAKVRGYKERIVGQGKCRREGSPIPCIDLFDRNNNQDINIGKQMVIENLAVADEDTSSATSSTLSLSKHSNDNTPNSPSIAPITQAKIIEEIDLTTPKKMKNQIIEEVNLITPKHDCTHEFLVNEIKMNIHENNGSDNENLTDDFSTNKMWKQVSNIIPGGDEQDSDNSDELEIG